MSVGEFRRLLTEDGRTEVIANHTGLDPERVKRIDRLGQPWPLGLPDGLGQECANEGINRVEALAALNPLLDMELAEREAKGGDVEPNPAVAEYIEKVGSLSGEEEETIWRVFGGVLEYYKRLNALVKEEAERRGRAYEQK